ncbi:DJ-1/PfpI family protein [Nocardiopsis ansamitocini]|uniref:Dimethylglycine dehydrogenase n=1 Tax=Nocardiopsis ansamitocini TaxID=1670832 RepID=A0A9W6UJF4_9ACTN|nr:DJ-1/PfpI family protein [Nocardiopsis ansamitocini]GLU48453.1 dimethylglycine dehydrogenase [Nocardiopsis ansamitocini]
MTPPHTQITIVLFPNVTQLDFTGPAQVFAKMANTTVELVAASTDPVPTDCGWSVVPTSTWNTAPPCTVLMVPGGQGAFDAMLEPATLDFVRAQAQGADWITSVCTGSFVLGAAGLLTGKRATSHWGSLHLLRHFGAHPISERVVRDTTTITGAGVSSGIDFALSLAARLHGQSAAERIQLGIEYDPQPPFSTGSPDRAPAEWVKQVRDHADANRAPMVRRAADRLRTDDHT